MEYSTILKQKLLEQKKVVLPEIGVLEVQKQQASVSDNGNSIEMLAPVEKIVFRSLTKNDTDAITKDNQAISSEIKSLLVSGANYGIGEIGSFLKKGNKYYFKSNSIGSSYGLPSYEIETIPSATETDKKGKRAFFVISAIAAFVIVALIFVFKFYDNKETTQNSKDENLEAVPHKEENIIDNSVSEIDTSVLYYIVTGSFENRYNAEKLMAQLKILEYEPQILKKENGVYRVILGSFGNEDEANRKLKEFLNKNEKFQVWVYKEKKGVQR